MIGSLIFAGGCVLGFATLRMAPRWVQRGVTGLGLMAAGAVIGSAVLLMQSGLMLAGLMMLGFVWCLDRVLLALREPSDSPSGGAPGGAHAPGQAGKRDGERDAPSLPSGCTTAGRAGRPRAFSEGFR